MRVQIGRWLWLLLAVAVLTSSAMGLWMLRHPILAWWNGLRTTEEEARVLPDEAVTFHFIDVGQGDCVLITSPAGNVLVDTGSNASEDALRTYLADQGIRDFAWLILTHPDEDHIGAADMILSEYTVGQVLLPDTFDSSLTARRVIEKLEVSGAERTVARSGQELRVGDLCLSVLAPLQRAYDDSNDRSIVLKATYGQARILLTGDAGVAAESDLLAVYGADQLRSDVLKVGHHGADTSSSQAFIEAVSPQVAVISAGAGNGYDHPRAKILERLEAVGARVYRTDMDGTVMIATDGRVFYGR